MLPGGEGTPLPAARRGAAPARPRSPRGRPGATSSSSGSAGEKGSIGSSGAPTPASVARPGRRGRGRGHPMAGGRRRLVGRQHVDLRRASTSRQRVRARALCSCVVRRRAPRCARTRSSSRTAGSTTGTVRRRQRVRRARQAVLAAGEDRHLLAEVAQQVGQGEQPRLVADEQDAGRARARHTFRRAGQRAASRARRSRQVPTITVNTIASMRPSSMPASVEAEGEERGRGGGHDAARARGRR